MNVFNSTIKAISRLLAGLITIACLTIFIYPNTLSLLPILPAQNLNETTIEIIRIITLTTLLLFGAYWLYKNRAVLKKRYEHYELDSLWLYLWFTVFSFIIPYLFIVLLNIGTMASIPANNTPFQPSNLSPAPTSITLTHSISTTVSISGSQPFTLPLAIPPTSQIISTTYTPSTGDSSLPYSLVTNPWNANRIAAVFVIIGLGISLIIWQDKHRQKFLVRPFTVENKNQSAQLEPIAFDVTSRIITELQNIGNLLSTKQVLPASNIRIDSDALNLIMSGGLELHTIAQMGALSNLELETNNVRIPLKIVDIAINHLARVRLAGSVHQQDDGTLNIRVELSQRSGGNPIVITEKIDLELSTDEISHSQIQNACYKIAVALAHRLSGQDNMPSTPDGFKEFIQGLHASHQKHWWHAIAHYRRAIELETSANEEFGIGHYHLGAALVSQGQFEDGINHLFQSELQGPKLHETDYMIALTLVYSHYYRFHEPDNSTFDEIIQRCERASIALHEAHHLMGMAYYMKARSYERERTKKYGSASMNKSFRWHRRFYKLAYKYLLRAKHSYIYATDSFQFSSKTPHLFMRDLDRAIQNESPQIKNTTQHDKHLLTINHQLADALRGLRRKRPAISYYSKVLKQLPRNLRTQVDTGKTYCVMKSWQKAINYLETYVISTEQGKWDADAHLYLGWAYSGKIKNFLYFEWVYSKEARQKKVSRNIGQSLKSLDYALHQRPRFITRWSQNDWWQEFKHLEREIDQENHKIGACSSNYSVWCYYWIQWRIYSYGVSNDHLTDQTIDWASIETELRRVISVDEKGTLEEFFVHSENLIKNRKYLSKLMNMDSYNTIKQNSNFELYVNIAVNLQTLWSKAHISFSNRSGKDSKEESDLAQRWITDVYAEISLLTARTWAKIGAYERVETVAEESQKALGEWVENWQLRYGKEANNDWFTFSPFVFRYQRSGLLAWDAFAKYQKLKHIPTRIRIRTSSKFTTAGYQQALSRIQYLLSEASIITPQHPLVMFTNALLHRELGTHQIAADILGRLLQFITPFDPSRTIARLGSQRSQEKARSSIRSQLYFMEKISGRQQFEDIVNPSAINIELSKTFENLEEPQLSVVYLHKALAVSTKKESDVSHFLKLATDLKDQERFAQARSIIEAVKLPLREFRKNTTGLWKYAPAIYRCVVDTRQNRHSQSLIRGREIARELIITNPFTQLPTQVATLQGICTQFIESELLQQLVQQAVIGHQENMKKYLKTVVDNNRQINRNMNSMSDILSRYDLKRNLFMELVMEQKHFITEDQSRETFTSITKILPKIFLMLSNDEQKKNFDLLLVLTFIRSRLTPSSKVSNQAEIEIQGLTTWTESLFSPTDYYINQDVIIWSNELFHISENAMRFLILIAELTNTLAYNKANLRLRLDLAYQDSIFSIILMQYIINCFKTSGDKEVSKELKHKMASYYDTLLWIFYQASNSLAFKGMTGSETLLPESEAIGQLALQHNPTWSIIHYHLARIHLSQIDFLWQSENNKSMVHLAELAPIIRRHIIKASEHWEMALSNDHVNRLSMQLKWLANRINKYRQAWNNLHFESFDSLVIREE